MPHRNETMENPEGLQRQVVFPVQRKDGRIMMEIACFDFRIINMPDGNQVIDMSLKTPYDSLTPLQMTEYTEMSDQISYTEMLKRRAEREEKQQRKISRNLLYKAACLFGLV